MVVIDTFFLISLLASIVFFYAVVAGGLVMVYNEATLSVAIQRANELHNVRSRLTRVADILARAEAMDAAANAVKVHSTRMVA